jgi:hypothetical protein
MIQYADYTKIFPCNFVQSLQRNLYGRSWALGIPRRAKQQRGMRTMRGLKYSDSGLINIHRRVFVERRFRVIVVFLEFYTSIE